MNEQNEQQSHVDENTKSSMKVLFRCGLIAIVVVSLCTYVSGVMIYNANQEKIK